MNSVRTNNFSFKYQRFTHLVAKIWGLANLKNSIDLIQLNLLKESAKYRIEIYLEKKQIKKTN